MKDIDITLFADEDEEYGKENAKKSLKVYFAMLFICVSVFLVLVCITKMVILRGAYIPENSQYFFALAAGFVLSLGLYGVFGKKIILKYTDDKYKEFASVSFDYTSRNYNKFWKIISKIGAVLMCVFSLVLGLLSMNDIGFYNDCFKESFALVDNNVYSYEDVNIYIVEGNYVNGTYTEYEGNNYVFEYGDNVYYFTKFQDGSRQDEFINDIAQRYNKQIIHCSDDSCF